MRNTNNQKGKNIDEYKLKGKLKRLEENVYDAALKGGYILKKEKNEDMGFDYNTILFFDENGNKREETFGHLHQFQLKHIFDENGVETEQHSIEKDILKSIVYFEYNESGKKSKFTHFDIEKNSVSSISYWQYDENQNLIKIIYNDGDDNLTQTNEFIYDANGHKIEQKYTNADGSITYWALFTPDTHGNAIETKKLNPDGSVKEIETKTYYYNSEGKIIGINNKSFNTKDNNFFIEQEFDHHGNWILGIMYEKKIPKSLSYRNIIYYDEPDNASNNVIEETIKIPYRKDKIEEEIGKDPSKASRFNYQKALIAHPETPNAEWLAMGGSSGDYPVIRHYALLNKDIPSAKRIFDQNVDVIKLLGELKENMEAEILCTYDSFYLNLQENELHDYVLAFANEYYFLQIKNIQVLSDKEYPIEEYFFDMYPPRRKGYVYIGDIILYYPSEFSGKRDEDFESDLEYYLDQCNLEEKPEQPYIEIVQVDTNNQFTLNSYPVVNDFSINDLDLNYGKGFEAFHDKLIQRFKSETKGLILLYGDAGTGKTYYIRHLLRHMTENDKVVIYMPPNMVDQLLNPNFITFLSNSISQLARNGNSCVLLVEDAEPLLVSREHYLRSMGISNLLNLTDGLLNDVLNIQIICTFNVKIHELDKALLRPGRLIAHKEFKALSALNANRLAQQLGIKHRYSVPVNISDVYALLEGKEILTHDTLDGEDV